MIFLLLAGLALLVLVVRKVRHRQALERAYAVDRKRQAVRALFAPVQSEARMPRRVRGDDYGGFL